MILLLFTPYPKPTHGGGGKPPKPPRPRYPIPYALDDDEAIILAALARRSQ